MAADHVRCQPQSFLLVELDEDDRPRFRGAVPRMVVDGEGVHGATATHDFRRDVFREALRALGDRGVQVEAAVLAAQEAQLAVGARRPEERVVVFEFWKNPKGGGHFPPRDAMRSARVMAVTMPPSFLNAPVPYDFGVVSTSVACARNAATVHWSFGMCANGSNLKWFIALRCVILLISSSGRPWRYFIAISGAFGHVESECG